jgi:hypothetical protein
MNFLYLEGALYTAIAFGTPLYELLAGDHPLTGRAIAAVIVGSIVSAANALKAFLSTSYSRATGDAILVRDQNGSSKFQTPSSKETPPPAWT